MDLLRLTFRNLVFYRKKTLPVIFLACLMIFLPAASYLLVSRIKTLADKPLQSLHTELILQKEGSKEAGQVRTRGVIPPFNLQSFDRRQATAALDDIDRIGEYSSALVLWEFDLQNNRVLVALDKSDPPVGLRKIESFLLPGGRFFSSNSAGEVVLERHFSKLFGYVRGGPFTIADREFEIVGIVDFKEQSNLSNASVFLPYETALALAGSDEQIVNQVFVSLASSSDLEGVRRSIAGRFPGYALITKDSLYKNLSSFNRLLYRGGGWFLALIAGLSLLLLLWIMKMHRQEFRSQTRILHTLGWSRKDLSLWLLCDSGLILATASSVALVLVVLLGWKVLAGWQIAPVLDQGFSL